MPEFFLKGLPTAASSPYALVAYALVVAVWALRAWRVGRPQSQARRILADFKDEATRKKALTSLLDNEPPAGLPEKEIIEWVRIQAREKSRGLLLTGYLVTVAAAIVVAVVALAGAKGFEVVGTVQLQRQGDGSCADLPKGAKLVATIDGRKKVVELANKCEARVAWRPGGAGRTTFALRDAADFVPADPDRVFWFKADAVFEVQVVERGRKEPRLKVLLVPYAGTDTDRTQQRDLLTRILESKLRTVADQIVRSAPTAPLGRLHLQLDTTYTAMSREQLRQRWHSEHLLEISSGIIFARNGRSIARSDLYLGDLSEPPSIQLDMILDEDEFGKANDSQALALVYALTADAEATGQPPEVITAYLDNATRLCQQLTGGDESVRSLKQSVSRIVKRWDARAATLCD